MTNIAIGEIVQFPLNNGAIGQGPILEVITQKGQPTLLRIGDQRGAGQAFRFVEEVTQLESPADTTNSAA